MTFLIIEVFICIGFLLLFYECCVKNARSRGDTYPDAANDNNNEDLRRFRERMSERAGGENNNSDPNNQAGGDSAIAARKEFIEKNLFSRVIHREESVKELSQLLAISRGGVVDEELGECSADNPADHAAASSVGGYGGSTSLAEHTPQPVGVSASTAASESTSLPTPSAPPPPAVAAARTTTTDTIATALSSPPPETSAPNNNIPSKHPITLVDPIRNLWSNLTTSNNNTGSEREAAIAPPQAATACQVNACTTPHHEQHKLECSICLDGYSPNDTIAWAKDGGDPPTSNTLSSGNTNNDVGCDHIFHKECLVSWLMQDHDECPLCRRKVVHTDVDIRFAGWDR